MDKWFLPITFLPAVGLFILSTSNILTSLNNEIDNLEKTSEVPKWLIRALLKQHTRLAQAHISLYISAFLFALAGFSGVILHEWLGLFHALLIAGVIAVIVAFVILSVYAFRSVGIRKKQHSE